jgi:hypothetical protein
VTADTTRGITTRYGASPSAAATWPSSGITIQNVRTTYTPKGGARRASRSAVTRRSGSAAGSCGGASSSTGARRCAGSSTTRSAPP